MSDRRIHKAARRADLDALRRELAKGVSPNALCGYYGWTPLHHLCLGGGGAEARVACLHVLLEAGANVNASNVFGTPLHFAANSGHAKVVAAMIKAGAAVNAQGNSGRTPLDYAMSRRRLVPILLRAGATPPAQTINAHIQEVIAAGGFGRYESNHLNALAATFAPHFAHLPPEIVRLVVEYAFHVGEY